MTHLYIGNTTRQIQDFVFRLPDHPAPIRQVIQIGQQIVLGGGASPLDLSQPEIDAVLDQHKMYGLTRVDEINSATKFVGLCYSVGKPIKRDGLQLGMEFHTAMLVAKGIKMRREAAVADHERIENALQNDGIPGRLAELDISVVQDNATGDNEIAPLAEGILVQRSENREPPVPDRGVRRARRSGRAAA